MYPLHFSRGPTPTRARSAIARRRFLQAILAGGLAAPALAGQQAQQSPRIDKPTLDCAEKIFGVDFTDAEEEQAARCGYPTDSG